MWPLLKNGDYIYISSLGRLQKGDILAIKNSRNLIITHRLVDEKKLITKGDNFVFPEKPYIGTKYEILGKLEHLIVNGKEISIKPYDKRFCKFSIAEMKFYRFLYKIIPIKRCIYFIRQVVYLSFIFTLRIFNGKGDYKF